MGCKMVFNEADIKSHQIDTTNVINEKIAQMERTKAQYLSMAEALGRQAALEEHRAQYLMKTVYYTDSDGKRHSERVPDTKGREAAAAKAAELRAQEAALRSAANAIGLAMDELRETLTGMERYINRLLEVVQSTDMSFAQKFEQLRDEIEFFNKNMQSILDSVDDFMLLNGKEVNTLTNVDFGKEGPPRIPFNEYINSKEFEEFAKSVNYDPQAMIVEIGRRTGAAPIAGASAATGTTYPNHGDALDFAAPKGTPILSTRGGTVTEVNWGYGDEYQVRYSNELGGYYEVAGFDDNGKLIWKRDNAGNYISGKPYGNSVKIQTDDGTVLTYAHMSYSNVPPVQEGDYVTAGQQIGTVGNTGNSMGNHLHFGVSNTENSVESYLPK